MGPYAFIGVFFILLLFSRVVTGNWTWDMPRLYQVDVRAGAAPALETLPPISSEWRRAISWLLNKI